MQTFIHRMFLLSNSLSTCTVVLTKDHKMNHIYEIVEKTSQRHFGSNSCLLQKIKTNIISAWQQSQKHKHCEQLLTLQLYTKCWIRVNPLTCQGSLVFHGDHNSHLKIAKQNVHEHFDKSATENLLCRPTPHVWQAHSWGKPVAMMEPFGGRTPLGGRMKQLFGAVVWNCADNCHRSIQSYASPTRASAQQQKENRK
jgi:hypothetical protein